MREHMDSLDPVIAIAPKATITDTTAMVSGIIDTAGYDGLTFVIVTGALAGATGTYAVTMEHGNDSALADTAVPAASDLVGSGTTGASFAVANVNSTRKVGYIGSKRYVRLTITPSGSNTGMFAAAIAIKGLPHVAPQPNPPA